ncbi:anhydro-N-acetylmuramic acid kinase [Chelonobacter oris]|uniref:Anhydro-N-acetylmuramic acid kinase n=1 Tax=Chelonobacter oris TaxID=505317 RepID=A0A0A3APJ5_9PAST|nr:YqcC family protein [Chelonobacter oris]KGQ71266.1 anhydro-N-acetylmuramic acid kinase [Chelonobacter oris]MDH3001592.1 anhydro-N-acetylmuramic acid kinase [Chelonobacter oris]
MNVDQALLRRHLKQLQLNLAHLALWQAMPPQQERLVSEQPFHVDTLEPHEWLQWIFLPRMSALLDSGAELPTKIAITPYIEEAMSGMERIELLLKPLSEIEELLNDHR